MELLKKTQNVRFPYSLFALQNLFQFKLSLILHLDLHLAKSDEWLNQTILYVVYIS